jgi:citrate synthase
MLQTIGSVENVSAFVERVKRKEVVLSGFGHRVYRTSDPRSAIIRKTADAVFAETGSDELLNVAIKLHDVALSDNYFKVRPYERCPFVGLSADPSSLSFSRRGDSTRTLTSGRA